MQKVRDKIIDLLTSDIPKEQILQVHGAACRIADYMIENGVTIQQTGHWVKKGLDGNLYCSECEKQSADNFSNFCPNCGSKNRIGEFVI